MYEHSKVHETNCNERGDGYNLNCDECNIDLETFDNFIAHMKDTHGIVNQKDIKPVRCRWCGERCRNLLGLCSHIRASHKCEVISMDAVATSDMINKTPLEKPSSFLCTVCGRELKSQQSYKQHMTIHSDSKPLSCDICSAKFRLEQTKRFFYPLRGFPGLNTSSNASNMFSFSRNYSTLINHKLIHTQERKQHCTVCGKSFKQRAHLTNHLKGHGIGIKEKFACTICKKEFLFRGVLKEHMW